MVWKTQNTGSNDIFKFRNVGDQIQGEFKGSSMVTLPGLKPFKTYQVQPEGNHVVTFSSTYQLEKGLGELELGKNVRITFNGQKTSKRGNRFNDFTIEVQEHEAQ